MSIKIPRAFKIFSLAFFVFALSAQAGRAFVFNHDLKIYNVGSEVKELQKFLNNNGYPVAKSGAGAKGKETTKFGIATKNALIKFQQANGIKPAVGYFGSITRSVVNKKGCVACQTSQPSSSSQPETQPQPNKNNYYSISGSITGVTHTIILQNNGRDDIVIQPGDNSTFTFPTKIVDGGRYSVNIRQDYLGQYCYFKPLNNEGTVKGYNVSDVKIACGDSLPYNSFIYTPPLGGSIGAYSLVYYAGANGSITGTASQTVSRGNSGTSVTAVAAAGYHFVDWSDSSTSNPRVDSNISADLNVTARFARDTTAGFTVSVINNLTTESGGTGSFSIVLKSQPTASVTIPLSSSNTALGTIAVSSVVFTTSNWDTPQTITVTGVDDSPAASGSPAAYTIITGDPTSSDADYNAFGASDIADVSMLNQSNDPPGVIVTGSGTAQTTESGGTFVFQFQLLSVPTGDVVIPISSSDTTEGTVSASSITITAANWNNPANNTITITGVNDNVADGNILYSLVTGDPTSSDSSYNSLVAADVADPTITNLDNDTAGATVTVVDNLTNESGGTGSFTIVLNSQPTADVTIPLSSSNTALGNVSVSQIVFTAANWNVAQTVSVIGYDDTPAVSGPPAAYTIITGDPTSSDGVYNVLGASDVTDVSMLNENNDPAGITVSATGSTQTSEAGATVVFQFQLLSLPSANVIIPLSSSDITEGTVSTTSITITPANWNNPSANTVTVTGINDSVQDGNIIYTLETGDPNSTDSVYDALTAADVADPTIVNIDNDTAGFTVSAASGSTSEGGATATFTVVLNTQPTANVVIPLFSSDTTEGTVSTSTLTFTASNWSIPQTVTITGVNDSVQDGNIVYGVVLSPATSSDINYNTLNPLDVSLTNLDNDVAGFTVNVIDNLTNESGGTGSFTIVLNSQPTASVTIPLSSSNTALGTIAVSSVVFTTANWNTPQTITVTGVDDVPAAAGPAAAYTITTGDPTSTDMLYDNFGASDVADVSMLNENNDPPGITLAAATSTVQTTEGGGTVVFRFQLLSAPTSSVAIPISSSDTTEGTVSTSSLVIAAANWNNPATNTVTVTGVNDDVVDGNILYTLITGDPTSSDPNYNALTAADVADPTITNMDNDTIGITVGSISGATSETGTTATFTVVLTSQPTANVSIPVSSSDTTEGTVSTSTLTFTNSNWSTPQTVTVTGVNDSVKDGNISYAVVLGITTSLDSNYSNLNPADITVTNNDNDYTLTYTAGANGYISGTTSQIVESGASGSAVTPTGNNGYHFVNWSDASTSTPRTDTGVVADVSVTANFAINTYTLTYTAGSNGSITGSTSQSVNHGSNGTAVTPVASSTYHFLNWSDGSTANPRTDTNIIANLSVTANFVQCLVDGDCAADKRCSSNSCVDNCTVLTRTCGVSCAVGSTCSNGTMYYTNNSTTYKVYSRDGSSASTACTPSCLAGWTAGNTAEMQTADTALNLANGTAYVTSDCSGVNTGLICGSGHPCNAAWVNWSGNWGGCLMGATCTLSNSYAFCYKSLSF
jgi:hypothetical protein